MSTSTSTSKSNRTEKRGLILLVVLGMLSLFSLLSVTYVVFSSSARTASLQMARRDFRGTPPDRLIDQAIRQVIRGTKDVDSVLWRQSLLEDLYGSLEDVIATAPRTSRFDDRAFGGGGGYTPPTMPYSKGDLMGPQLYGGSFLKIPCSSARHCRSITTRSSVAC